jgi:hypothetical protein
MPIMETLNAQPRRHTSRIATLLGIGSNNILCDISLRSRSWGVAPDGTTLPVSAPSHKRYKGSINYPTSKKPGDKLTYPTSEELGVALKIALESPAAETVSPHLRPWGHIVQVYRKLRFGSTLRVEQLNTSETTATGGSNTFSDKFRVDDGVHSIRISLNTLLHTDLSRLAEEAYHHTPGISTI